MSFETSRWSSRPSFRPYFVAAGASLALGLFLLSKVGPLFQDVINSTAGTIAWSQPFVEKIYGFLQMAVFFPLLIVLWKFIQAVAIKYEISEGRLLYHHGILLRRHDQIALQRVRDYRVIVPLWMRFLGIGKIHVISRDETYPELTVGPFARPLSVEAIIRSSVLEQQERVGFKEFETT